MGGDWVLCVDQLRPQVPPVRRTKHSAGNPKVALDHDATRRRDGAGAGAPLGDGRGRDPQVTREGTLAARRLACSLDTHGADDKALPNPAQVALPNFAPTLHA